MREMHNSILEITETWKTKPVLRSTGLLYLERMLQRVPESQYFV